MNHHVADDATEQAFDRDDMHPAQLTRQQGEHGGDEHRQPDSAETLGQRRLHLHRTEPANPEHRREDHEQKRAHAEELQQHVGAKCANDADPVAGRVRTGQDGGAVPRRVERRIRNQREEKEERGDAHQESDQLIEPPVPGGDENACQIVHVGQIHTPKTLLSSAPQSARALTLCQENGVPTMQEMAGSVQLASRSRRCLQSLLSTSVRRPARATCHASVSRRVSPRTPAPAPR